jgi:hypothetical protein
MARTYDALTDDLSRWLLDQHVFFVATAPLSADGHVNLSPKGHDSFRVLSPSCGFSVPLMSYERERPTLIEWADRKGPDGLDAYRSEKNATSIDGLPALRR